MCFAKIYTYNIFIFKVFLLFSHLWISVDATAQFSNNNLAIIVADASATNTTANIVEINKNSAGQSAIQTIAIPGTGTNAIRVSGSATSTLYASNSDDGSLFCFTGHNSTNTSANANTLNPRAVVTINNAGAVNVAAPYTGGSGNQTRSATTINNTNFYIADQGGFYTNGATSASPGGNIRSIRSFGGVVYAFTSSASAPPVGTISAITGGTFTALPGLANGNTTRQDFYLISSGSNGSAFDILYVLDAASGTSGTILKYSLVSGSWTANGTYATSFGGFGLAAETFGSGARLYLTTGTGATTANSVIRLTDAAGYNATINITTGNNVTLYTTAAGTIIKGVAFAPKYIAPEVPTVSLSANPSTGTEADATVITVTVTASAPVTGNQTVSLAVTGLGITAGDYTLSSNTIFIPNGSNTGSITFTVTDDNEVEGDETAILTISNPSSGIALGSPVSQNVLIVDNDVLPPPTVTLSVSTNNASEAESTSVIVTVTASSPVSSNQSVILQVSGTNITPSDYYLTSSTIYIPNGQTTGTTTLVISDDATIEGTETAILTITSPTSGITIGNPATQNISITNNNCSFIRRVSTISSTLGAEIPAFDPESHKLYVVAGTAIEYYDISTSGEISLSGVLDLGFAVPPGTIILPNSASIKNGILAVAYGVQNSTTLAQQPGRVGFYIAASSTYIHDVTVGYLPDMVIFSPDGSKVLTANEGEPNSYGQPDSFDPEGSVSIIDISSGITSATVQTANFSAFDSQINDLRIAGVRIYGPGATVSQDLEPEYIAFSGDGLTAMVTLQENNAFAVLDIANATITSIIPMGLKNHNITGNKLDASDRDVDGTAGAGGKINMQNWPIHGMYQPDAIASYSVGGQTYYITANEGDSRAYTGYSEEIRVGAAGYVLDLGVFPNAATLKLPQNLGRLQLSNATGDLDGDGDFDRIDALGARSFAVWNSSGQLVYDSGDMIEQVTAAKSPTLFNSEGDASNFDTRSDNKGPEPEGVAIGYIGDKPYAFIGLERTGDVIVYDISVPSAPVFVQYINTPGDLAVEGLIFVKASSSPTGRALLITTAEVSKTTTVYEVGTGVVTSGANDGNGSLRAAIGCVPWGGTVVYDQPGTSVTTLTSQLLIDKDIEIHGLSSTFKPNIIVDFAGLGSDAGIIIGSNRKVIFKNVNITDINNTNLPENAVLKVESPGELQIKGSVTINKND